VARARLTFPTKHHRPETEPMRINRSLISILAVATCATLGYLLVRTPASDPTSPSPAPIAENDAGGGVIYRFVP